MLEQRNLEPAQEAPIGTLMIVDDNAVDQMIYRRILKRSSLVGSVYTFLSARDALEFLRRKNARVDAILLDINMPGMDGFEFLEVATQELGSDFTELVVIMLTTSLDPNDAKRARMFPVVKDYLNKPLVLEHLYRIAALLSDDGTAQVA